MEALGCDMAAPRRCGRHQERAGKKQIEPQADWIVDSGPIGDLNWRLRKMSVYNAGRYYGHSENDNGAGLPELLSDHLNRVANWAARFAAAFGADQQAFAAGLLHDLGKYAEQFCSSGNILLRGY
jgi:hypothetical protein